MRNILKKEINILLTSHQHALIAQLKETGINMSSLSRLAIRKFGAGDLTAENDAAKTKRAVIYLETTDIEELDNIAQKNGITKSEALRRLLAHYLSVNENALKQLFQ